MVGTRTYGTAAACCRTLASGVRFDGGATNPRRSGRQRTARRPPRRTNRACRVASGSRAENDVMEGARQLRFAEDLIRRLAGGIRAAQLYAPGHPLVQRSFDALSETIGQILVDQQSIAVGFIEL